MTALLAWVYIGGLTASPSEWGWFRCLMWPWYYGRHLVRSMPVVDND